MGREQHRNHARIHDAQVPRAVHHQVRIHDAVLAPGQYGARPDRVVDSQAIVRHVCSPLGVGVGAGAAHDSEAGFVLGGPDAAERRGVGDLAEVLGGGNSGLDVVFLGQVVGVDGWRRGEGGRGDVDGAETEGMLD